MGDKITKLDLSIPEAPTWEEVKNKVDRDGSKSDQDATDDLDSCYSFPIPDNHSIFDSSSSITISSRTNVYRPGLNIGLPSVYVWYCCDCTGGAFQMSEAYCTRCALERCNKCRVMESALSGRAPAMKNPRYTGIGEALALMDRDLPYSENQSISNYRNEVLLSARGKSRGYGRVDNIRSATDTRASTPRKQGFSEKNY
jgi:hypothetical protein